MTQWIRHAMLFVAGVILVLHVVLPHSHVSELSFEEHTTLHAETDGVLGWIELLLHEHEQFAERFVTNKSSSELIFPALVVLVPLLAIFTELVQLDDTVATVAPSDHNEFRLAQLGYVSSWGVRPPPVA